MTVCFSAKTVAEAFCPLPKSLDSNSFALSILFLWAHYPDLSVTKFAVQLEKQSFVALLINLYSAQCLTLCPREE